MIILGQKRPDKREIPMGYHMGGGGGLMGYYVAIKGIIPIDFILEQIISDKYGA